MESNKGFFFVAQLGKKTSGSNTEGKDQIIKFDLKSHQIVVPIESIGFILFAHMNGWFLW